MQKSKLALATALSCILTLSVFAPAQAKKLKMPEKRVIKVYQKPDLSGIEGTIAAGSGSGFAIDPTDLRRYQETSRSHTQQIRMMQSIISEIRLKSPDPTLNPKVYVFNADTIDARAINRDTIIFSTSLLQLLSGNSDVAKDASKDLNLTVEESFNTIAFILAHEYAHLLYGHPTLYKQKEESTHGFTKLVAGSLQVMHIAQGLNQEFGGNLSQEFSEANKVLNGAALATPWVQAELNRYSFQPFTRKAEQLADYMASDLLSDENETKPKYNPQAGSIPMKNIYPVYDKSVKAQMERLLKDAEQTASVASTQMIASAPAVIMNGGDIGAHLTGNLKSMAVNFAAKKILGRLKKKKAHMYYSADKRVEGIGDYYELYYPNTIVQASAKTMDGMDEFNATQKNTEDTLWISPEIKQASIQFNKLVKQEHSASAAADQAMKFLAHGDIEGAVKALNSAVGNSKYTDTKYITVSGYVAFAQGNIDIAISKFNQVKSKGDVTELVFRKLSQSYMLQDNEAMAISALDEGMKKFSTETYIAEKIGLLVVLARDEEALKVYDECVALDNKKLKKDCKAQVEPILEPEEGSGGLFKGIGDVVKKGTGL